MIQNTIHSIATEDAVRNAIERIPEMLRGGTAEGRALLVRMGLTALGRIKRAFIVKARGGTDEAGESWKPLSPKTIAYSKTRRRGRGGRTKTEKKRASRPSQALSSRQQARWWDIYRRNLKRFAGDKGHAAAVAWLTLKREGAETLLQKYGGRQVEILRDTGLLLNSLSPGVPNGGPATPEQVFRTENGAVIIGTNRKGAAAHHSGIPGKLPQRRLWPEPHKWPASWWRDIVDQVVQGVVDTTIEKIRKETA